VTAREWQWLVGILDVIVIVYWSLFRFLFHIVEPIVFESGLKPLKFIHVELLVTHNTRGSVAINAFGTYEVAAWKH
jgi:hypothetical protein